MKSWFSEGIPAKTHSETRKVKFSGHRVFHSTKVEKGAPLVVANLFQKVLGR